MEIIADQVGQAPPEVGDRGSCAAPVTRWARPPLPGVLLQLPTPESLGVRVRPGVLGDVPFMDALQKLHTKQVGWMPTKQLEGHVAKGHVLIAEAISDQPLAISEGSSEDSKLTAKGYGLTASPATTSGGPVGYCIAVDTYFKREDVGIIYQLNVLPGRQRGLIGATLLKAQFERSAYGGRLYCCWCAQDIAANRFWEAMGFAPLAFRTGSEKRSRIHIFWQKAIRAEDENGRGPNFRGWWFPSKTGGGAIKEDRLVLPIPPGTHWSDAKPMVLPNAPGSDCQLPNAPGNEGAKQLPEPKRERVNTRKKAKPVEKPAAVRRNGLMFDIPKQGEPLPEEKAQQETPARVKRPRPRKHDPRYVAAARELRDRWLEQVAAQPGLIEATGVGGKYDVSRRIGSDEAMMGEQQLPGAGAIPGAGVGALPGAGLLDAA